MGALSSKVNGGSDTEKESLDLQTLLKAKTSQTMLDNFVKDVDSPIIEMHDAMDKIKKILDGKKPLVAKETKDIQQLCQTLVEVHYKFTNRFGKFFHLIKSAYGIEISPSISPQGEKINSARGESTHTSEPKFEYKNPKGIDTCPTDSGRYPFEGECDEISVTFKTGLKWEIFSLIKLVESSVQHTLREAKNALEKRLP